MIGTGQVPTREYQRAFLNSMRPMSPLHRRYGVLLAELGRNEEAIAQFKQSMETRPAVGHDCYFQLGAEFYFARQYDRTIEQEKKALELAPRLHLRLYDYLSSPYLQKSMYTESIAEFEKMLALSLATRVLWRTSETPMRWRVERQMRGRCSDQLSELSKHRFVRGSGEWPESM